MRVSISENIARVHEQIEAAARRCGRDSAEIALMAVSKTQSAEVIREAYTAGQRLFGENRVQEFSEKVTTLQDLREADWHMIGHVQTNKAARAAELFHAVDSVDSLKLADKLNASARIQGKRLRALIEVNVGGEEAKSGLRPNDPELERLLSAAPGFSSLAFVGLMTVPPFTENPEGSRPYFRQLREVRDSITRRKLAGIDMSELSIGMSHDFEIAIEEGSTCVRIGTAIFGVRARK